MNKYISEGVGDVNLYIVFGIIAGYFALILGVIMVSRYRQTGSIVPGLSEFLLANRNIPSLVLSFTFVASLFSTAAVIAFPSFVYTHGIAGVAFIAIAEVIGAIGMIYFYDKLRKYALEHDLFSPIECLSKSYDSKWLGIVSACITILFLLPYIALQLVAVGAFLEGMTDGAITYLTGVGFMMLVVLVYILFGGMRAVAYTDMVQGLAILIGFVGGAIFFVYHYFGGIMPMIQIFEDRYSQYLSLPGGEGLFTPLYFSTALIMTVGIFFQPQLLTRGIMARDKGQVKATAYGLWLALLIYVPVVVIYGIGAHHIYGDDIESNAIMGRIFSDMALINGVGLVLSVLFLVGAIGAAMSTADSMLLSSGQMVTRDIVRPYKRFPRITQVWISRFVMAIMMGLSFLVGLNPPEFMIDLALASIAAGCAFMPTYLGFTWARRSKYAAFSSILLGESVLLAVKTGILPSYGMHEGFWVLSVSTIVYVFLCVILSNMRLKA